MTKYILAGGSDRLYPDYGKRLTNVIRREVAKPTLLVCFFAQSPEAHQTKYKDWQIWFSSNFDFARQIIWAEEATFLEQVKKSDVIYLYGGETRRLMEALPDAEAIKSAFEGKIVIGSSAGANYLARLSYSPSKDAIQWGGGLLDVGVIVHYGLISNGLEIPAERWPNIIAKMRAEVGDSPLVLLPEGNFTVIES